MPAPSHRARARYDPYSSGGGVQGGGPRPSPAYGGNVARQRSLVGSNRQASGGTSSMTQQTWGGTGNVVSRRRANREEVGDGHRPVYGEMAGQAHQRRRSNAPPRFGRTYPQHDFDGATRQDEAPQQYDDGGGGYRTGNTGAAPLMHQVHPLLRARRRPGPGGGHGGGGPRGAGGNGFREQAERDLGLPGPVAWLTDLLSQGQRVASLLLGTVPEEDLDALRKADILASSTEEEVLMKLLSAKSTVRVIRLFLLVPLLAFMSRRVIPPAAERATRPRPWAWSAGVALPGMKTVERRNLAGRNCVMNYFIEKQPPDEYDPDYQKPELDPETKLPKPIKPVKIIDGTYRTKGQVHVISRFIEAVADSFRSNTNIRQHLIFTESRDSGHLAYEAIRHWPPRGKHRTTVHVVASDALPPDGPARDSARALGYGSLGDIEERFRGNDRARIYDRDGNLAGVSDVGPDTDDDEVLEAAELEVPDSETVELRLKSGRKLGGRGWRNTTLLPDGTRPYPSLRAMLPFEDEDEGDGDIVVPYLHVDGTRMSDQMLVLESARSLLEDNVIVVVGIEHSPDLDPRALIDFFRQVKYKTFFLGARQVARIDNLCDEVLSDVLDHPSVKQPGGSVLRRLFIDLGLVSGDELRISGGGGASPEGARRRETPPFFVAMPRGRRNREEMTIQHMYDLFGGYGGGGGQIKTANDRKAPGK